jgi:5-methyltetrahydrofolate--homocysteine methyltransferase
MGSLAPRLRAATRRPLLIRPTAGQPQEKEGTILYPQSAGDFARGAARILDAGVNAIGGCCGTTPDTIRALASLLARRQKPV